MDKELIKGLKKLYWLTPKQIKKLEHSAQMHRRYSNIGFKVVSATEKQIVLKVLQGRHLSENYASKNRLIEIGKETFGDVVTDRELHTDPVPFDFHNFTQIFNGADLEKSITERFKYRRDFLEYLSSLGFDIDEAVLSGHINSKKEFTKWHRMAYSCAITLYKTKWTKNQHTSSNS